MTSEKDRNEFDQRTYKILDQYANIAEQDPTEMVNNAIAHIRAGFVFIAAVSPSDAEYLLLVHSIFDRVINEGKSVGKVMREMLKKNEHA